MASERKGGVGRALAGILEAPAPPDIEETEAPLAEPVRETEARPAKKRKVSRVSSKKAGVTGRTMYLHDDLFALIRGKAIKRKETVSEFASWVFESHFGVQAGTRKKKTSDGAGESEAA
jgi:hypothetical protein